MDKINPSEITSEDLYRSRRKFLKRAGLITAGSLWLAACRGKETLMPSPTNGEIPPSSPTTGSGATPQVRAEGISDDFGDPLNTFDEIYNFNN